MKKIKWLNKRKYFFCIKNYGNKHPALIVGFTKKNKKGMSLTHSKDYHTAITLKQNPSLKDKRPAYLNKVQNVKGKIKRVNNLRLSNDDREQVHEYIKKKKQVTWLLKLSHKGWSYHP